MTKIQILGLDARCKKLADVTDACASELGMDYSILRSDLILWRSSKRDASLMEVAAWILYRGSSRLGPFAGDLRELAKEIFFLYR